MHRLFITPDDVCNKTVTVRGGDVEHLHALRVREGDVMHLSDGVSCGYEAEVREVRKNEVIFDLIKEIPLENEPVVDVTVYCALLKGGGNEEVIQRSVELGAKRIVFFTASNCIAEKREKSEKYAKTARQAAMQAGRDIVPEVVCALTFAEMLDGLEKSDFSTVFHEKATEPLYNALLNVKTPRTAAFAVGPEGGFSDKEISLAQERGISILSMGGRILRAVTAPLCALSVIISVCGQGR